MRSLSEVTSALPANADVGLTEVAVVESRQRFGRNVLTPLPREPLWQKFIEKFDEPIIIILLAAALLSMIVELFKHDTLIGGISFGSLIFLITAFYLFKQRPWI